MFVGKCIKVYCVEVDGTAGKKERRTVVENWSEFIVRWKSRQMLD